MIQLLLFADDLMLVAERDKDAVRNVKVLDEVMKKWRMKINWRKTKAMVVKRGGDTCMQHLSEWGGDRKCEDNTWEQCWKKRDHVKQR